jgi:hypothetical protein
MFCLSFIPFFLNIPIILYNMFANTNRATRNSDVPSVEMHKLRRSKNNVVGREVKGTINCLLNIINENNNNVYEDTVNMSTMKNINRSSSLVSTFQNKFIIVSKEVQIIAKLTLLTILYSFFRTSLIQAHYICLIFIKIVHNFDYVSFFTAMDFTLCNSIAS